MLKYFFTMDIFKNNLKIKIENDAKLFLYFIFISQF